ncbi:hypothetical protein KQR57_14570 [Bacillus inaquosorum]|nr:hypothetical protein [Bacillus inaquosorum]
MDYNQLGIEAMQKAITRKRQRHLQKRLKKIKKTRFRILTLLTCFHP